MSVYYKVKEHIEIRDRNACNVLAQNMINHIAALGKVAEEKVARFSLVKIIADGTEYSLSGKKIEITEEFFDKVQLLMSAETFSVTLDYSYSWSSSIFGDYSDPTYIIKYATKANNDSSPYFFYSVFLDADCDDEAGTLSAYGTRNGKMYTGKIEALPVKALPHGDWRTDSSSVYYDADLTGEEDIQRIEQVCKDLLKLTHSPEANVVNLVSLSGTRTVANPRIDENYISFTLDYLNLTCDEDCREFVRLCAELIELSDGECSVNGFLNDQSSELGRVVEIDIEGDGSYVIKLAEI